MKDKLKLACFPYSGASSSMYFNWKKHLNPRIELVPIELSGHGAIVKEPLNGSNNKRMLNSKIPSRGIFAAQPFLITHPEGISRIKGTRIPVSVILEHIADGQSGG